MKKIKNKLKNFNTRRLYYRLTHDYLTLDNIVIAIGLVIAAGWVVGSLQMMQRNYTLQTELEDKSRQLIVAQLATANAKLEQSYYKTNEYQELAVRKSLGLVTPGESVLILPDNSESAKNYDSETSTTIYTDNSTSSNFKKWMNFLFGGNVSSLSTEE